METAEELLKKILTERAAVEKAFVAERNLGLEFEKKKLEIELELYTVKAALYPGSLEIAQKKLDTQLRLAVLLETFKQIDNSMSQ
jgi:hypothetical protein